MARRPLKIEWSVDAMADLDRFANFLHEVAPELASFVATEVIAATRIIGERPLIGRPTGNAAYRQFVLRVLNASYILQYRIDGDRVVILRVFHSREQRGS